MRVNNQTVVDECKAIKRIDVYSSSTQLRLTGDGVLTNSDPTIEIFESDCDPTRPNLLRASMGPTMAYAKQANYQKTTGATCSDPQALHQFQLIE